jgi:hypothetical protein
VTPEDEQKSKLRSMAEDYARNRIEDLSSQKTPYADFASGKYLRILAELSRADEVVGRAIERGALSKIPKYTKALAPAAQTAVELGKAAYLLRNENAREGHAEAGKELMEKPLAYQVGKTLISPADSMSKYGARKEELDKKNFEKEQNLPWAKEWVEQQNKDIQMKPSDTKSKKQVAYLLSKVSPLSKKQQGKLKKELHSGAVKVKKDEK